MGAPGERRGEGLESQAGVGERGREGTRVGLGNRMGVLQEVCGRG
jgi:hypothetical protein